MIHLLWCTIRTQNFPNIHKIWHQKSNKKNYKTHVLVSTEVEKEFLTKYFDYISHDNRIEVFKPNHPGVCEPSYKLSSTLNASENDIIIFGSDDFTPPQDWDIYLEEKLKNKEGGLMVRDGYQMPDSSNMAHPCITIPIMTFGCFEKLNKVIYHPSYTHMHSDAELYLNLKDLGLLIDDRLSDKTEFTHHHYAAGKRNPDQFDQSYHNKWKEDEMNWNKRRNLSVEERVKIIS